jgi:hypothetical protein
MSLLAPRPQYPSFKFDKLGAEIEGVIVAPPEDRQARDFDTGKPAFWDDEKTQPKMQTRIVLRVADGTDYAIYAEGRMARAITAAIRKAGVDDLEVNGRLRVKHHELGEPKGRGKAPKLYESSYVPPVPDDEPPF